MGHDSLLEDSKRFRRTLGHYPTGVVVVAAVDQEGEPMGLSLGTFTSVSLNPQMIGFFADAASTTWPRIRECDHFAVNVLSASQAELARSFARSGTDKFAGVKWHPGLHGCPIIEETSMAMVCELEAEYDAGDHSFVLGRVLEFELFHDGAPLIFYLGEFGTFAPPEPEWPSG